MPRSQLDTPMAQSDPALRELLDAQARTLLEALPQTDAFDRAIQHTVVRLLPDGDANLASVARALHVSARTLQRRLAAHGLTWQAYLDRTRSELARSYLADPALTLADIAMLLGYSEQSAFNRAYRRWTQQTPARMRKDVLSRRSAASLRRCVQSDASSG